MGVSTQPGGGKNARKVTIEDDIPVRQPDIKNQTTTVPGPQATASPQSTFQAPGPGFDHQVTNYPGGWSYNTINGLNPTSIQQPQVHQTPGFARGHPGLLPSYFPTANTANVSIPYLGPHIYNNHQPQAYTHFTTVPHYHVRHSLPIMADYGNGSMPNTGQHFQPPVPDTTYGAIPHTYTPRFDSGVHMVSSATGAYSVGNVSVPIQHFQPPQQVHLGMQPAVMMQSPPATTGIATTPIMSYPPMAYQQPGQQPVYVQGGGYPVQQVASPPVVFAPQQMTAQPAIGIPMGGQSQMYLGNGAPGTVTRSNPFPDVMGVGKTAGELTIEQLNAAYNTNILEPQDMKPADDDPSRMYYCRELDGQWTQRNRYTIDHLPCRWYVTEQGAFYAVRLED